MLLRNLSDSKNSFFIKLVKENPFSETCLIYLLFSIFYCQKSILFRFPKSNPISSFDPSSQQGCYMTHTVSSSSISFSDYLGILEEFLTSIL